VGAVERAWKWARRRPAVAALLAAVAVLAVGGFALVTWQWREAVHQRGLADEKARGEAEARRDADERQQKEEQARLQAERLLAGAVLDQGITLCDRGEVGQGLLWLARGLDLAVRAGDADLERVARTNLSAWRARFFDPATWLSHGDWVWTGAFSPDGKRLLTCESSFPRLDTNFARLWDAATGRPLGAPLRCDHNPWVSAFSPDGKLLFVVNPERLRCWRVADRRPVRALALKSAAFTPRTVPAAFSPDGTRLAGAAEDAVRLWDSRSGQVLRRLPFPEPVRSVQFSPDGQTLLLCSTGRSAQLWDVALARPKSAPLTYRDGNIRAAAFSPDSRVVVTGCEGSALLWDAATGKRLGPPLAHLKAVTAVAFRPDGRALVTGCADGAVLLWPVPEPEPGGVEAVRRRAEALTRLRLDERGIVSQAGAAAGR
jgi:hypothetical protein